MQVTTSVEGGKATVRLSGRFDFNTHREFRVAYEAVMDQAGVTQVVVDLAGVDYLDSSALGMLLMLRDRGETTKRSVTLTGVKGSVKQVLDIANFSKIFRME
jgi:HptB-dependent secretion and biofilm anti anti-sigma factor